MHVIYMNKIFTSMESIRASRELIKEGLLTVETEKLLRDIGKQM